MTELTQARIPQHLKRYIVDQNYDRYTAEDQAVWRFILRKLKTYLSNHAHPVYRQGLKQTGISIDHIPSIASIDEHLESLGWGAVAVSGFIPPAAFMEFQSLQILPIASDMRSLAHLEYTPAPDIVHEAAGHAPILVDPEYAHYLLQYGTVAKRAIIFKHDLDQYEAIRVLSDLKEDPAATREEIAKAELNLNQITSGIADISEASFLSRMNWWTAEYGLIGKMDAPKIYGAGLLSSVGESKTGLGPKVKKIPLTVDCINYGYDITERQPQLFVTESFAHLSQVLKDLSHKMAFTFGGRIGLERVIRADTVNTVQLNSGLQISGRLKAFRSLTADPERADYLFFDGPCQLSLSDKEIDGQGTSRHKHGFSSPLGYLKNSTRCLSTYSSGELIQAGLKLGQKGSIEFTTGVKVEGTLANFTYSQEKLVLLTWRDCKVKFKDELLFDPSWGEFDQAIGSEVVSVYGGPADRSRFGQTADFVAQKIPLRNFSSPERTRHSMFARLRTFREKIKADLDIASEISELSEEILNLHPREWLPRVELMEILKKAQSLSSQETLTRLESQISSQLNSQDAQAFREFIEDGLNLVGQDL